MKSFINRGLYIIALLAFFSIGTTSFGDEIASLSEKIQIASLSIQLLELEKKLELISASHALDIQNFQDNLELAGLEKKNREQELIGTFTAYSGKIDIGTVTSRLQAKTMSLVALEKSGEALGVDLKQRNRYFTMKDAKAEIWVVNQSLATESFALSKSAILFSLFVQQFQQLESSFSKLGDSLSMALNKSRPQHTLMEKGSISPESLLGYRNQSLALMKVLDLFKTDSSVAEAEFCGVDPNPDVIKGLRKAFSDQPGIKFMDLETMCGVEAIKPAPLGSKVIITLLNVENKYYFCQELLSSLTSAVASNNQIINKGLFEEFQKTFDGLAKQLREVREQVRPILKELIMVELFLSQRDESQVFLLEVKNEILGSEERTQKSHFFLHNKRTWRGVSIISYRLVSTEGEIVASARLKEFTPHRDLSPNDRSSKMNHY